MAGDSPTTVYSLTIVHPLTTVDSLTIVYSLTVVYLLMVAYSLTTVFLLTCGGRGAVQSHAVHLAVHHMLSVHLMGMPGEHLELHPLHAWLTS